MRKLQGWKLNSIYFVGALAVIIVGMLVFSNFTIKSETTVGEIVKPEVDKPNANEPAEKKSDSESQVTHKPVPVKKAKELNSGKAFPKKFLSSEKIEFPSKSDSNNISKGERKKNFSIKSKIRTRADLICSIDTAVIDTLQLQDGNQYSIFQIKDFGQSVEIGSPSLPLKNELIRKTAGADLSLVIDDVVWEDLPAGIVLAPVQPPIPDVRGLNGERPDEAIQFAKNEGEYQIDEFVNPEPIKLGETVRVRGREYVNVAYSPVSYNPVTKEAKVAVSVKWHLEIAPPKEIRRRRPDRMNAVDNDKLDIRVQEDVEAESPDASAIENGSEPPAEMVASAADADYLIITPDSFEAAVTPLAEWKHQKGYKTYVATLTEVGGNTESDIQTYIKNAYDNGTMTTYVLLIGDHEDLPGFQIVGHPYHGVDHEWHVDYTYSLVDGGDNYPDIYIARLPADNTTELTNMVNAAIAYDKTPDTGSWYDDVLVAGQFQDSDDSNLIADRCFMEDLHQIADFLGPDYDFFGAWNGLSEVNKGYTVHTALQWDSSTSSALEYQDYSYVGKRTPPTSVPQSWKDMGSGNATQITLAINSGVGLVFHRDHGYSGTTSGGEGWADPNYQSSQVNSLANGAKKPFVFSLNCATGWFDGCDKFAESWMRNSNGGAIGYTGAARVSYSGYNDCFHMGIMDTFWNDYTTYDDSVSIPYPNSWRPAEAVVRAKGFILTGYGTGGYGLLTSQFFNWFGDPELSLRTETPVQLVASHDASFVAGINVDTNVTVTRGGSACQGALIALVMDSGNVFATAYTDASGVASVNITPTSTGDLSLTVTEQNSTPYIATIPVVSGTDPVIGVYPASISTSVVIGSNPSSDTFTVANVGVDTVNYTISDDAAWLSCNPTAGSSTGEEDIITVTYSASGLTAGTYNADITITDSGAINSPVTIPVTLIVDPLPPVYAESFESGLGDWVQSATDTFDWTVNGGATPSSLTGPSLAQDESYYIFTEATGRSPGDTAVLNCTIDLSTVTSPELSFYYHMFGEANNGMGTLDISASSDGSNYTSIFSKSSNQGEVWHQQVVDISSYGGGTLYLRITGTIGPSFTSDMAVDNITIVETSTGFSVTYDGNGADGGTVPVDGTSYAETDSVTVLGNTGSLTKTGNTFTGWNTAANGSGTSYSAGNTFSMGTSNVTLYAQWTALPTYTVSYNGNSNTGGTAPGDQTKVEDVDLTLATQGSLVKTGYEFSGWDTAANGSGTAYASAGTYTENADLTLYAQWTALPKYTVSYSGNGNTGGTAPSDQTKTQGIDLSLASNTGSLVKTGYAFMGWNTLADGTGTDYAEGANYSVDSALSLYAKWNANPAVEAGDSQTVYMTGNDVPWTPGDAMTTAWYDAADADTITESGGAVSQWDDKSGNNYHMKQTNGTYQPVYTASDSVFGNRPSINTGGAYKYLTMDQSPTVKRMYFITYYGGGTATSFASHHALVGTADGSLRLCGRSGDNHVFDYSRDAKNFDYPGTTYRNGSTTDTSYQAAGLPINAEIFTITADTSKSGQWRLLANNANYTLWDDGGLGEMIFTDGTEDLATQQKIEGYLAWKWGIQDKLPTGHPYSPAAPVNATSGPMKSVASATATLAGQVTDSDDTPTHTWSDTGTGSGTGTVDFVDVNVLNTDVTFSATGTYILRLTADDGNALITDDVTITVSDPVTTYTVTFDEGTHGSHTGGGDLIQTIEDGSAASAPTITPDTGYSFDGWDVAFDNITSDLTVTAQYSINQYTITFDSAGGSSVADITLDYGATVTAPTAPTKTGYTFSGWSPSLPATMPASNTTCTAQWTAIPEYSITYNGNGNDDGDVPEDLNSYLEGEGFAILGNTGNLTKNGFVFDCWNGKADGTGTIYSCGNIYTMGSADLTLYAVYVPVYTLTVNNGTGGGDYTEGSVVPITATVPGGQHFVNWTGDTGALDDANSASTDVTMPASAVSVTANFADGDTTHSADTDNNWVITQSEVSTYITSQYQANQTTEPRVTMRDVMRVIYLYNGGTGGYIGGQGTYDGYDIAAAEAEAPETTPEIGTGDEGDGSLVVSSTADSGVGSLRDAIAISGDGETIIIDGSVETITLLSEIVIDKSITIDGQGVAIVSGTSQTRVFRVENTEEAIDVTLKNIGIVDAKNAADEFGGALYNNGQTLTLDTVLFDGNSNTDQNGKGGAVYSSGTLNIENCVFSNNTASEEDDVYSE